MKHTSSSTSGEFDPALEPSAGQTLLGSLVRKGLDALGLLDFRCRFWFHRLLSASNSIVGKEEKQVMNACVVNCASRCPLKCHVVDGVIRWITQEDNAGAGDDVYGAHQVRGCLRGRSARRRVYAPDRLKHPMKRVGKRGEGKFEHITWTKRSGSSGIKSNTQSTPTATRPSTVSTGRELGGIISLAAA